MADCLAADDARLDAHIAVVEHGRVTGNTTDPNVMWSEHHHLVDAGLLDPDEPTPWTQYQYQRRLFGEFTPQERARIRIEIGMEV